MIDIYKKIGDMIKITEQHEFLMLKAPTSSSQVLPKSIHAPFALYSGPYSKRLYEKAMALQDIWNELIFKLSLDGSFIDDMVKRYQ
jgi:Eukaryotic glutathione synthase, ATP binding domain